MHSRKDRRYDPLAVIYVITLLDYGCPVQASAKALGVNERTVADWHEYLVEKSQQDLQQARRMKSR